MASNVSQGAFGCEGIRLQLCNQGVGAIEFLNVPQPLDEGQFDGCSVQMRIVCIEQVCFHGGGALVVFKGGSRTDVNHGRPAGFRSVEPVCIQQVEFGCIHTGRREQLQGFHCGEIGGAKTEYTSPCFSFHDFSSPSMGAAQQLRGGVHTARFDALANLGAGNGQFSFDMGGDVYHVETIGFSAAAKQFHIAFAPCSESMVMSDCDGGGAHPPDQNIPNEFLRAKSGKGNVEWLHYEVVQSSRGETGSPLVERLQKLETRVFPKEHGPGVWIKRENHGFRVLGLRLLNHPVQQGPMPEVHTVKGAGRHDPFPVLCEVGKSFVDLHAVRR